MTDKKFNDFDYGLNLRPIDFMMNPHALYDRIQKAIIYCKKCHKKVHIYLKKECIKLKCECGITRVNQIKENVFEINAKSKYLIAKQQKGDSLGRK